MLEEEVPPPTGPFYSNYGPRDGMIMLGGAPVMGVLPGPNGGETPIGIAWLNGSIPSRRGPVQVWRLTIGKVELEGRWIVKDREFIRMGDAAEEV